MIDSNLSEKPILLDSSMFFVSEQDEKEKSMSVALNNQPYFTYKYKYPINKLRWISNFKDRLNIFFNESNFIRYMSKYGEIIDNFDSEEDMNLLMEENLLTMIEILFPTKYPIVNNIHTSLNYVQQKSSLMPLNYLYTVNNMFSHLKINGEEKTIKKVYLYNDVLNHPLYYQLIKESMLFQKWAESGNYSDLLTKYDNEIKSKKPIQYINFEKSYLLNYRSPNKIINNSFFQNLIEHDKKKDINNYVDLFHKCIKYFHKRYFKNIEISESDNINDEEILMFENILSYPSGICSIDLRSTLPKKEIYLHIDFHEQRIDDDNVDEYKCYFIGEELGEQLQKMILGIRPTSYFIKDNIQTNLSVNNTISNKSDSMKTNKTDSVYDIEKVNILFMEKYNNNWTSNTKETIKEKIGKDFLNHLPELVNNIQSSEYNKTKTLSFDYSNLINDIFKNKLIPENLNTINQDLIDILTLWVKINNDPEKYRLDSKTKLLIKIDKTINNIKTTIAENKIILKDASVINSKQYENTKAINNYLETIYKMYEFIIIYIVYSNLTKIYPDIEKLKYKTFKTGGNKTKKHKYRKLFTRKNLLV